MKQRYVLLFVIGLTIMLLFVSCQSETEQAISTSSIVTVTSTAVLQPSSEPPIATTVPPAMTAEQVETTSTSILAPPMTPSATLPAPIVAAETLTRLPTLTGEALEAAMAELLTNPMYCEVPCWWGAIPSETMVFEVQQFLALYQFTDYKHVENQVPDYIDVGIGFNENENHPDFRVEYYFENNLLKIVFSERSPLLHDILEKYGKPDEVWLETMSFEREEDLPVRLNLIYLQAGIAVGYVVDGNIQDGVVTGCFADDEVGLLQLNAPGSSTNYRDFGGVFEEDRRYLSLVEATGLTIEDFIQRFSDPTQPQCIETPAELWK